MITKKQKRELAYMLLSRFSLLLFDAVNGWERTCPIYTFYGIDFIRSNKIGVFLPTDIRCTCLIGSAILDKPYGSLRDLLYYRYNITHKDHIDIIEGFKPPNERIYIKSDAWSFAMQVFDIVKPRYFPKSYA